MPLDPKARYCPVCKERLRNRPKNGWVEECKRCHSSIKTRVTDTNCVVVTVVKGKEKEGSI